MSIFFFFCSKVEPNFEESVPSVVLLSLVGAGCIVAFQSVSCVMSTSVVEGTIL